MLLAAAAAVPIFSGAQMGTFFFLCSTNMQISFTMVGEVPLVLSGNFVFIFSTGHLIKKD